MYLIQVQAGFIIIHVGSLGLSNKSVVVPRQDSGHCNIYFLQLQTNWDVNKINRPSSLYVGLLTCILTCILAVFSGVIRAVYLCMS